MFGADGAILLPNRTQFNEAIADGHQSPRTSEDKKGYISWKGEGARSVRVLRPTLIREIEEDWTKRSGALGRWIIKVRADGSPASPIEFVEFDRGSTEESVWDRVIDVSRRLAVDLGPFGLLARVQGSRWPAADGYINGWNAALESGPPTLALHGTVEVQSLSGRTLGLIVTPLHPLRLAWHGLYDQVAAHARYEQKLTGSAVQSVLRNLDSSSFPATLPRHSGKGIYICGHVGISCGGDDFCDGDPLNQKHRYRCWQCVSVVVASNRSAHSRRRECSGARREIGHYLDWSPTQR